MDENNENMKKKSKGLIAIILALVIIILGMGIYIAIDKEIISINLSQKERKNKDNNQINKKKDTEEKENVDQKEERKPLDLSKCLNNNENAVYSDPKESLGDHGLVIEINQDQTAASLSIDWNKFGPLTTASSWSSSIEKYPITGFTKKIASAFIGGYGQDAMGTTLFYLMDDQTVEYTPMFIQNRDSQGNLYYTSNKTGETYLTKGSISGVKDVIKLYIVNKSIPNGSSSVTTIAATKDGSFYDLGIIINN